MICDRSDPSFVIDLIPEVHGEWIKFGIQFAFLICFNSWQELFSFFCIQTEAAGFQTVKFNAKNLSALEILELFNKHITPLAPKEEEVKILSTKATKKKR